jgi:hypothetical protein
MSDSRELESMTCRSLGLSVSLYTNRAPSWENLAGPEIGSILIIINMILLLKACSLSIWYP